MDCAGAANCSSSKKSVLEFIRNTRGFTIAPPRTAGQGFIVTYQQRFLYSLFLHRTLAVRVPIFCTLFSNLLYCVAFHTHSSFFERSIWHNTGEEQLKCMWKMKGKFSHFGRISPKKTQNHKQGSKKNGSETE